MYYCKPLLQHIIAKVEECSIAREVVTSVDVLIAVRWVAQVWESVLTETIKKCFRKAGIADKDFRVVSRDVLEDDPFADLELNHATDELQAMITRVGIIDGRCSDEDDQLYICSLGSQASPTFTFHLRSQ